MQHKSHTETECTEKFRYKKVSHYISAEAFEIQENLMFKVKIS